MALIPSVCTSSGFNNNIQGNSCNFFISLMESSEMDFADDNSSEDKIVIDVGGSRFVTTRTTLLNVPDTRLSDIMKNMNTSVNPRTEIFFDRNPFLFEYILDFYRSGELHLPQNRCGRLIQNELFYWGLDEACVSKCCWKTYTQSTEAISTQSKIAQEFYTLSQKYMMMKKNNKLKTRLWTFLACPNSSTPAKVYSVMSCILVVLSTMMVMLSTLPEVRVDIPNLDPDTDNSTINRKPLRMLKTTTPHVSIMYIDLALAVLVLLEFFAKLVVCPRKIALVKSFSSVADVLHFLPVIVLHFVHRLDQTIWPSLENPGIIIFFQSLFALRVLRLYRVACCFREFKVLMLSLKASFKELFLLISLVLFTSVFFAFMIFYVELSAQESFSNAFVGLWWALITMTSVGYGDVFPLSPLGYIVGVMCAFTGIILISLPVPMVANNFNLYYAYKEGPDPLSSKCHWHKQASKGNKNIKPKVETAFTAVAGSEETLT